MTNLELLKLARAGLDAQYDELYLTADDKAAYVEKSAVLDRAIQRIKENSSLEVTILE